jgi:hypothetical protein
MMIMIEREKALQLTGLVILCVAVGVFWAMSPKDQAQQADVPVAVSATDPLVSTYPVMTDGGITVHSPKVAVFAEYRMELDRVRAAQIELLQTVLQNQEISAAQRDQLNTELRLIMQRSEAELQAEILLRAKGYPDAIVVITQNGANVVVPAVLTQQDAAVIGELVARASGVSTERITIIDGAS